MDPNQTLVSLLKRQRTDPPEEEEVGEEEEPEIVAVVAAGAAGASAGGARARVGSRQAKTLGVGFCLVANCKRTTVYKTRGVIRRGREALP